MASNKEERQNKYWRTREDEALKHYLTEEVEYKRRIDEIYADMLESCQSEIDRFYRKYASDEGISLSEAKKRVSKLDIAEYERKAKRYVQVAEMDRQFGGGKSYRGYYFSKQANDEMRLYNATMKINRLEMLKANIGLELVKGTAELETFMEEILQGRTEEELERQAGILGDTIKNNAEAAHTIVNASFHNATFSERLWNHQTQMKADLSVLLQRGLIQGKGNRELARELQRYFIGDERMKNGKKGAKYRAETLMRTELARVQTAAQEASFKKMGFEEYTFHANSGCCGDCQDLNGKHFKLDKMAIGENAPPIHPRCRCSVSAYSDRKEYDEWLDFLSKGGTTEQWKKRNDKAYQEQIKARREAYKKRHAEKQAAAMPKTVDEFSKASTNSLLSSYEERRLRYNLNLVPANELDPSFTTVKAVYKGVSEKTAAAFHNTISRLSGRYYSGLERIEVGKLEEFLGVNCFATTAHNNVTVSKSITLNPHKMKDYDKWTDRVYELGQNGWGVRIDRKDAEKYIATHEFAHTLLDMNSSLTNYIGYDHKNTRAARKEINKLYSEYKNSALSTQAAFKKAEMDFMLNPTEELGKKAAALSEEYRKTKISEYSLENADEFMAEAFTYRELVGNDNPYANKVVEILDKYYGKE